MVLKDVKIYKMDSGCYINLADTDKMQTVIRCKQIC